jgi:hypothetical protein
LIETLKNNDIMFMLGGFLLCFYLVV